jgi:hypothetical protein
MTKYVAVVRIRIEDRNGKIIDMGETWSDAGPEGVEIEAPSEDEANRIWARKLLSWALTYGGDNARKEIRKGK